MGEKCYLFSDRSSASCDARKMFGVKEDSRICKKAFIYIHTKETKTCWTERLVKLYFYNRTIFVHEQRIWMLNDFSPPHRQQIFRQFQSLIFKSFELKNRDHIVSFANTLVHYPIRITTNGKRITRTTPTAEHVWWICSLALRSFTAQSNGKLEQCSAVIEHVTGIEVCYD